MVDLFWQLVWPSTLLGKTLMLGTLAIGVLVETKRWGKRK